MRGIPRRALVQARHGPNDRPMSTATAAHYATVNPYTGETLKEFETLSLDQVDLALAAADEAFEAWRRRPIAERAADRRRAGELLAEREDQLGTWSRSRWAS